MKVSIVILNYNTPHLVKRCIDSIRNNVSGIEYETIVVDNCSSDDRLKELETFIGGDATLVKIPVNTGFGLGNAVGAFQATGDYLCFLNSDVEFYEDCLSPICNYLHSHPEVGMAGPQQYDSDRRPVTSFKHDMGIRHQLLGDGIFERLLPEKYPDRKDFSRKEPFSVKQIAGCFMIFPTSLFWQIGGFDTNIFLYYEEYDLGRRIIAQGRKCMIFPQYGYLHIHGVSTSTMKKAAYRELMISKIYIYEKYHGTLMSFLFRTLCLADTLFKIRKWYLLPLYIRGNSLSQSLRHHTR